MYQKLISTSSEPLPEGPTAVVGPQFCEPCAVDLTVTKNLLNVTEGYFSVTDVNGNVVFKVKGSLLSIRDRRVLVDVNGAPILSMQQKIWCARTKWQVFRGESSDSKDLLFSVKQSALLQVKTKLNVFLAANTGEESCDFKIEGSFLDKSSTIYQGDSNTIVAQMRKHRTVSKVLMGRDTYCVTVYPHIDCAFIVALIIILDEDQQGV